MSKKYLQFVLILLLTAFIHSTLLIPSVTSKNNLSLHSSFPTTEINFSHGKAHYQETKFAESLIYLEKAYEDAVNENKLEQQIKALNWMAMAYKKLGELQKAESAINNSIQLINSQTNIEQNTIFLLSQAFNIQGNIAFSQGKIAAALLAWQNAQKQAEIINDEEGIQGSLINQVTAYSALGEYVKANRTIKQLETQLRQQANSKLKIYSLVTLGVALQRQGNLSDSESLLRQSLVLAQELLSTRQINQIRFSLGNTLRDLKQTEEALNLYEQIINNSQQDDLLISAKLNQLTIYIEQNNQPEINQLVTDLKQKIRLLPATRNNIYARINFVQSLFNLSSVTGNNYSLDILSILSESLTQGEQIQDKRSLSYVYGMLGKLYLHEGQLDNAQKLTQKALALAQTVNASDIEVQWQGQMGSIYQQEGNPTQAISFYQNAVNNLESLSQDLYGNNAEIKFSFRESVEPIYRELINLLLTDSQPSTANLQKSIEIFEQLHLAELKNFFGDGCLVSKSVEEIEDQQGAIIYPIILDDRLVVITSLPHDKLIYHSIDIPQAQLESTLVKVRNSLHPTASNRTREKLTKQMYDWLIADIEDDLQANHISTLIFALDGMMRNLPMASLYDGQNYLIEKYAIALIPVRVDLFDPQPWQTQQLDVLIGGLSESRQGFSSLPAVELEVEEIASQSPSKILLNRNFTAANLAHLVATTSFPVLHLATHGQFSSRKEDTFLLAWNETINISDLEKLIKSRNSQEAIELLILSACQTAIGDKRAALGLAGLALRSGAKSVVATLWSVNDQSTAQLMVNFYEQLQTTGISKSEALRQAQLKLLQSSQYKHPYYWTPFVMVGNWL